MKKTAENRRSEVCFMSDETAAVAARTCPDALDYLFNKYRGMVCSKARTYYIAGADSEDIMQEGMIGLYSAICRFRPEKQASFHSFAEICVTRSIITAVKRAARKKHAPLNNYVSMNMPAYGDEDGRMFLETITDKARGVDPEESVIDRESAQLMETRIKSRLSTFERSVAELYISGVSYKKIAKKLGRSPKSVDNALQRIKSKAGDVIIEEKRAAENY